MSSSKNIGGRLDMFAYSKLANQHRPTDLDAEIRRLSASGLTPLDIAAALRLDPAAVVTVLGPSSHPNRSPMT